MNFFPPVYHVSLIALTYILEVSVVNDVFYFFPKYHVSLIALTYILEVSVVSDSYSSILNNPRNNYFTTKISPTMM